ncbi:isopeptide-forming domain-containing fimbrial protein [Sarcina ventriculi]|uniref:Fimbrial isopeptide formation D2 domain n=1 Tax=Sarcina ventriculi TaxID=1267 RepID=A0ABM9UPY7_SARVE|nr:isopeptide-forming domain-containing fimbrial protein [Sarcina ventriculi]CUN82534.1 fimbrial isopeptide formation D2 domain [Sarcina ventriculi]
MACDNTIQVLNGSVLTFESEVQICNSITNLTKLQFRDILQGGLKVTSDQVNLTINNTSSTATAIVSETNNPEDTITVEILAANLGNDYPVTVKVKFQATVNDLDALLENADDPTNAGKLTNTGTFTALDNAGASIGKPATVTLADTNVEEYSPEVSGYSITVCPSENDAKFEAKLCLNTLCGDYTDGKYVLDVTAPDGISFYEDATSTPPAAVESYTGCCCKSTKIEMATPPVISADNKTVTITIASNEVDVALENDTDDSCNNNISVYIPCRFDNAASACTNEPLIINGSIKFTDDTDNTLAELKNFGLYVNVDCGNLVGVSKTILC